MAAVEAAVAGGLTVITLAAAAVERRLVVHRAKRPKI